MIAILDTNVLVSALFDPNSPSASLLAGWEGRRFDLLTCEDQFEEFRRVTRYPKIAMRITTANAGRLVLRMRKLARVLDHLPAVDVSRDQADNYLLALAGAGPADFLVTGDKADLLELGHYGRTRIVTVRQFVAVLGG